MTSATLPDNIQAAIHQDAINRVTDFFNAKADDILNELLQNARRAGATQVNITAHGDEVTVADDGRGIADPATILAFGQSRWDETLTQSEHPAGMGLYSLARRDTVTVRSKNGHGAWQVTLTPDNFTGKLPAPVERLSESTPQGTSISFSYKNAHEIDYHIRKAAKHYPLPVTLNCGTLERVGFLHDSLYTEEWEGVTFGVHNRHASRINFHGVVITDREYPIIQAIHSNWGADTDVTDSPKLQLTLPSRKEVVETRFTEELRAARRRAIYRAMRLQPQPVDVAKAIQDDARQMGVELPDARPLLPHWIPRDANYEYSQGTKSKQPTSESTLVMELTVSPADQQALYRAAEMQDLTGRMMQAEGEMAGYSWYDRLTRITRLTTTLTHAGKETDLLELREHGADLATVRPDRIVITMHGQDGAGNAVQIPLDADLAFENEEEEWMDDNHPLITKSSRILPGELADLLHDAYFYPSDDSDADSFDTQQNQHREASYRIALSLLQSPEDAARNAIVTAVRSHILYEVPPGMNATITLRRSPYPGPSEVTVTLEPSEPEKE